MTDQLNFGICDICLEEKDCIICFGNGTIKKQMCSRGSIENKCLWCNGTGHTKHGRTPSWKKTKVTSNK